MSEVTMAVVVSPLRQLSRPDETALTIAVRRLLKSRGLVVRIADLMGGLFGSAATAGWKRLRVPEKYTQQLKAIGEAALRRAFDVAILGRDQTEWAVGPGRARMVAAATGAVAGFVGLAGFLPDATFTTLLIMRNIAAIATEEGESLDDDETKQACLEVFALGSAGFGESTEEGEASYWSARLLMHGRPMSLLLSEIAATYGLRFSQQFVATVVPVVGAASGALVNSSFVDHYRNTARVHFTIRRLEREYGSIEVRARAEEIATELRIARRSPRRSQFMEETVA